MPLHREYQYLFPNTAITRFNGIEVSCSSCFQTFTHEEIAIGHLRWNHRAGVAGPDSFFHPREECVNRHYDRDHHRECRREPQNNYFQQYEIWTEEVEVGPDEYIQAVYQIRHAPCTVETDTHLQDWGRPYPTAQ